MQGLNITIMSYNLPHEYKKATETLVTIETSPEGYTSSVSFPTEHVPNSSSFFPINVHTLAGSEDSLLQNFTKEVIITIASKYKIKSQEIIAVGYIYPEDFPSNLGDQNNLLINLFRPSKSQTKRKKAKSLGSSPKMDVFSLKESQKKIIGCLKVQLSSSKPYFELNQKASWSLNHRSLASHKSIRSESSEKELIKSKHTFKTKNKENEIYNQIV